MSSRARSGTPTGLAAGRRSRSTRSARATTVSRTAASRANRAGRDSDGGRVKVSDAPAKKWAEVMRPPAPGVKFCVPTWVQVEKLTQEERQDYEKALEAAKQRKEEANKVVSEPTVADVAAAVPIEGSVENKNGIANDPSSNNLEITKKVEEQKSDAIPEDDNNPSNAVVSSDQQADPTGGTEEPPLKRAKRNLDVPSASGLEGDIDLPKGEASGLVVNTMAVEDEDPGEANAAGGTESSALPPPKTEGDETATSKTASPPRIHPGETNAAGGTESSALPVGEASPPDPPKTEEDETAASKTASPPRIDIGETNAAGGTKSSALPVVEASPPGPPKTQDDEPASSNTAAPTRIDPKISNSPTPEVEAGVPNQSKTAENEATTGSTVNQTKVEPETQDSATPEGEGSPKTAEDPPTTVSQMDHQGNDRVEETNAMEQTTTEDGDSQENEVEESTKI